MSLVNAAIAPPMMSVARTPIVSAAATDENSGHLSARPVQSTCTELRREQLRRDGRRRGKEQRVPEPQHQGHQHQPEQGDRADRSRLLLARTVSVSRLRRRRRRCGRQRLGLEVMPGGEGVALTLGVQARSRQVSSGRDGLRIQPGQDRVIRAADRMTGLQEIPCWCVPDVLDGELTGPGAEDLSAAGHP
jgi:hypothetical protein